MTRPLRIGLSARFLHARPGAIDVHSKTVLYVEQSMAHWVMSRDVMVLMVPSVDATGMLHQSNMRLRDYVHELDGLVLQGGADVSPVTYGEEPLSPAWAGDRVRDEYEIELFDEFVEAGKPVLGICRGLQLINVAFGGTLYQDIATQTGSAVQHRARDAYESNFHDVSFEPESGLGRMYPRIAGGRVNSIHHQAIHNLGRDLVVEARSSTDGIIEAIRWRGKSYVFGVQWHPEYLRPRDDSVLDCTPILEEFLLEARRRL
jgi:putative glutamine amidotransferase